MLSTLPSSSESAGAGAAAWSPGTKENRAVGRIDIAVAIEVGGAGNELVGACRP